MIEQADRSEIAPNPAAIRQRTIETERSPPLSVTLNGRPKGRIAAEINVKVMASAVMVWVTSMNRGSVRPPETQPL